MCGSWVSKIVTQGGMLSREHARRNVSKRCVKTHRSSGRSAYSLATMQAAIHALPITLRGSQETLCLLTMVGFTMVGGFYEGQDRRNHRNTQVPPRVSKTEHSLPSYRATISKTVLFDSDT